MTVAHPPSSAPSADALAETLDELAEAFTARFPETLRGPRTIGREAEYPMVWPDGQAADIRGLWPLLMEDGDLNPLREGDLIVGLEGASYSYSMEVGWGTIEVITEPCNDLHALKALHETAMARLLTAAKRYGCLILGYGIQPLTPQSEALMSPKKRYHVLHDVIGTTWQWFTTTASDQAQIDITRHELIPLLNLTNLLCPVVIAFCANSPIYGGHESGWISSREGTMGQIHASSHRHGMPARAMRDPLDWIETLAQQEFLVRKQDGVYIPQSGTFIDYLRQHGPRFDDFLMHEHYIWNSGRPRCAHATIELRSACQQPWAEHFANSALGLGLIEAGKTLLPWLETKLHDALWPAMRDYHQRVLRQGIQASEPFDGLLEGVLQHAHDALLVRGFGEEIYLAPLYRRLQQRRSPGHDAIEAYRRGGWDALREQLTCNL